MKRLLTACIFLLVLMCAVPVASEAYVIHGHKWPGRTITYYDATPTKYHWSVAEGVKAWNTSGVRIHFTKVTSRSRAQIIVSYKPLGPYAGYASIGYQPRPYVHLDMKGMDKYDFKEVVAHEFGHVLGLDHVHGCAVMSYDFWVACKKPTAPWLYHNRVLQPDDLRGAIKLYGGHAVLQPLFALREPAPPILTGVSVTPSQTADTLATLTWHASGNTTQVEVLRYKNTCTGTPDYSFPTTVKQTTTVDNWDVRSGTYCYSFRAINQYGYGPNIQKLTITYTAPAPAAPGPVTASDWADGYTPTTLSWATSSTSYDIQVRRGSSNACPQDLSQGENPNGSGYSGTYTVYDDYAPGTYCYSVFYVDYNTGQASAASSVVMTHNPQPAISY